jgi:hypothetical protein
MKKYIRHILPWVVKNKINSLRGVGVDPQCIPFFHVGNNDKQGIRK